MAPRDDNRPSLGPVRRTRRSLSPAQALTVAKERLLWNRRADSWDAEGSAGLSEVVQAVVDTCRPPDGATAVDLGAGSGQVTLPLADRCERMLAVDLSEPLLERLQDKAAESSITNISTITQPLETLDLQPASVDLIVSNYALHHLRDPDKARLIERCYGWLAPGGQLVIGDMMFGRGTQAGDRQIIASKVSSFLRRGPAGWWRLAKNVLRFTFRIREKPMTAERWEQLASAAGFEAVTTQRVVAEACVLSARKPRAT